jgi:hypothetical protein
MKHAVLVAAVVMVIGAGWLSAGAIWGEQPRQGPSAAPPPASESPSAKNGPVAIPRNTELPSAEQQAQPSPSAAAPESPSAKNGPVAIPRNTEEPAPQPVKPAPVAVPKETADLPKTDGLENIIPPPQIPDVDIPPIPEVKKTVGKDGVITEDPFTPGPWPVAKKKSDAIDEGKRLFDREGRLEVDPIGRPVFVFDSGDKPMQLLESTQRELLEAATDRGKRRARWRISGIVTVYEGKNFLLVTRATRILAEQEKL